MHLLQQILRSALNMEMNHHSCILPREASREKHGTSAQIHLCFSLHNPEFHNLAGKLGGNPKFCLVARQHHVKAEILKNFDLNHGSVVFTGKNYLIYNL